MPIVGTPTPVVDFESLIFDGLELNDGTNFWLDDVAFPPPRQRQDWIGAADSETQLLFRNPLHENRKVTATVQVSATADKDGALAQLVQVVDKCQKASKYTDGIALVWSPAGSTLSCTFDVLTAEITDLPVDFMFVTANAPLVMIELTCKPYWRGTEVLTGLSSSSTPILAFEITSVTGDIPALGRLIITDTATQSRRHVEWGLEGPLTYNAATSLLIDSDDMIGTPTFSGAQATRTGAYDPNALGNNNISLSLVAGATTALAGTGNLSHVGVFRVKARMQSDSLSNLIRFSWKAGDGPTNHNGWVSPIAVAGSNPAWQELDLGTITVPATTLGTQRWTGQVEVQGAATSPGSVQLDYLILIPMADGYGKARATYSPGTGVLAAQDAFVGTTAGNALGARTAPLGGSWATSGDVTDFAFADNFNASAADGIESIIRSTSVSETSGRFAILGTTNYTDTQVDVRARIGTLGTFSHEQTVIARWTDSNNYARLVVPKTGVTDTVTLEVVVAGAPTTLASYPWAYRGTQINYRFRLIAYASGRILGYVFDDAGNTIISLDASSSVLATGGTLASGKPGLRDRQTSATVGNRYFTEFVVQVPAAEPIALYSGRNMQVRYDDTLRQDSTGTYYGRPPSYRGSRFLVPLGTSRVLVKARRNDVETALDDVVTDALQAQVGWTPRGLVVPRA